MQSLAVILALASLILYLASPIVPVCLLASVTALVSAVCVWVVGFNER